MVAAAQVQPGNGTHPLCWIDIQAGNMEASQKFYSELFGWSIMAFGPDYAMFTPPAGLMGALTAKPEDLAQTRQGSTPYLYTPDFAGDVEALHALGLSFVQEPQNVSGANVTVFLDAAGTQYGLIDTAPQLPIPHLPPIFGGSEHPPAGTLWSIELYGGDFAQAKALFGERFGWGTLDTQPQYVMFDPGAGIGGVFQSHTAIIPSMPYIWVDDVRATLDRIAALGGIVEGEPVSLPGMGTFGYFNDPSGTAMGLIGP
ncbi:hypothetical protein IT575_13315 [bacterium]|nr:hypothetical protein [bacterium]